MSCRLEDACRHVSWTVTKYIMVGYNDCSVCGVETPPPSTEQLLKFARSQETYQYLWPREDHPGCRPAGWENGDDGLLCPGCVAVKDDALNTRRAIKKDGGEDE